MLVAGSDGAALPEHDDLRHGQEMDANLVLPRQPHCHVVPCVKKVVACLWRWRPFQGKGSVHRDLPPLAGEGVLAKRHYVARSIARHCRPRMIASDAALRAMSASLSDNLNLRFKKGTRGRGEFHQWAVAQTAASSTG